MRITYDSNLRYLPLMYFLPEDTIAKCPTLRPLPRKVREVLYDENMMDIVESEQFLNEIMDAVAALTFPHFGFGGWKEHYTGDCPVWKLSYALPLWAKLLETEMGWGLQRLMNIPSSESIPFFAYEYVKEIAKQKGGAGALEAHHERTKEKYASNSDIDTERSKLNIHIIRPTTSYKRESDGRIEVAVCKTRKDSVRFVDTLITASPDFFKGKKREEVRAFFQIAVDFLSRKIGKDNIFTAVVHLDEKTPHMHLCFTPITQDGRLSAKDIIGNRVQLTKWQDDFFNHMVKSFPDIERGESASVTGRKHIPTRVFKQAVRLTRQAEQIEALLDGLNPLNAGKKKEEVIALLHKFFPAMESFETVLKRCRFSIARLERENVALAKKATAGEKEKFNKQLETAQLQADYYNLQRFVDSLPEEIKRQVRLPQKSQEHQI